MRSVALMIAVVLGMTTPVLAQGTLADADENRKAGSLMAWAAADPHTVSGTGAPGLARPIAEAAENDYLKPRQPRRPASLPGMYSTLAALNVLDVYSTMRAMENGAREANPFVARTAGSAGASLAIKAATTTSAIYFAEKLWRKNRAAAIITMVAINAGTAAAVARNFRNARAY